MEARVTAPTWEIGIPAVVHDFTPGEVILLMDDQIAGGTHVTIQLNTYSFTGEILFCEPKGSRYEAHVSFEDVDATGLRRTPRFPVSIPARVFSSTATFRWKVRSSIFLAKGWESNWQSAADAQQHRGAKRGKHRARRGPLLQAGIVRALSGGGSIASHREEGPGAGKGCGGVGLDEQIGCAIWPQESGAREGLK